MPMAAFLSLKDKQKETDIHYKCFSAAGGFKKWFISGSINTPRPEDFYNCRLCGKKSTISYFGFYDLQKKSFACFCLTCASRELYDLQVQ